jgi:membrane associated rhomboid family serine protease
MLPEELFSNLQEPSKISWQAHLAGAIVGVILALLFKKVGDKKKKIHLGISKLLQRKR